MIGAFLTFLTQSRLARLIGLTALVGLVVKVLMAISKREGVTEERAREAQRDAQANEEAHDRINKAETGAGLSDDQRRERLRDFAAKHGTRPPKAGGR